MGDELVELVKEKPELRGVSDKFVSKLIAHHAHENPKFVEKYDNARDVKQFRRSKEYKEMLKEVRATLREVYGVFIMKDYEDMEVALDVLEEDQSVANHVKILNMHKSSKERLPFYERIYEKIFEITGVPDKVLDLACGLNPFSYPFMGCEPEYLASDISPVMCSFINRYFEMRGIEGESFVFDLLDFEPSEFTEHARSDVCFLFKTLDSLESLERDVSERIITGLPADYVVVSFPRVSIGGAKEIADARRGWFEDLLDRNDLEYEMFKVPTESFYVVKK